MKISGGYGFVLIVALLIAICQPAFADTKATAAAKFSATNSVSTTNAVDLKRRWRSVIMIPSTNLPSIHTYQKFNPIWWFENSDEPVPPAWYRTNDTHRVTKWHFRNPLHNFSFYVIGIADKKSVRSGRYPAVIANPNSGWNFAISRRKIIFLPFFCYQHGKFEFYLGWHPHGSFGVKLNYSDSNENPKSKPTADAH